jgi:hypothetical protein
LIAYWDEFATLRIEAVYPSEWSQNGAAPHDVTSLTTLLFKENVVGTS